MKTLAGILIAFLLLNGCVRDDKKIYDEFKEINTSSWNWNESKTFTFTITDATYAYNIVCGLRITGSYNYSNIWLLYTIEGEGFSKKQQFQIPLSDNTGKWLGTGMSNLISYDYLFLQNVQFKPGKYTIRINQNMRDEKLTSVSDIGLKIYKETKIY